MTSQYDNQSHIVWLTCAALLKKPMDEDLLDPVLEFSVPLHITVTRVIKLHHASYKTTNRYQKRQGNWFVLHTLKKAFKMPWQKRNEWFDANLSNLSILFYFICGAQIDYHLILKIMLLIYEAPEPKSIVSVEEVGNRF